MREGDDVQGKLLPGGARSEGDARHGEQGHERAPEEPRLRLEKQSRDVFFVVEDAHSQRAQVGSRGALPHESNHDSGHPCRGTHPPESEPAEFESKTKSKLNLFLFLEIDFESERI